MEWKTIQLNYKYNNFHLIFFSFSTNCLTFFTTAIKYNSFRSQFSHLPVIVSDVVCEFVEEAILFSSSHLIRGNSLYFILINCTKKSSQSRKSFGKFHKYSKWYAVGWAMHWFNWYWLWWGWAWTWRGVGGWGRGMRLMNCRNFLFLDFV